MIKYKFGNIECELSWKKFLCVETDKKYYKKDFKDFGELYYFIENNKNMKLTFDGYEYFIENNKLHNLYGAAKIKHTEKEEGSYFFGTTKRYFINGEIVYLIHKVPCKNDNDFFNNKIYHYKELTNKKNGKDKNTGKFYRRKENVDYTKTEINIKKLIENDKRKQKLNKINEQNFYNK